MKICIVTPIYERTTSSNGATPVVHYFAKEWVKLGHEVVVYNLEVKFPDIYYRFARLFQKRLSSRLGMPIPSTIPHEFDDIFDGVVVHRRLISKIVPHSRFSESEILRVVNLIKNDFVNEDIPDYFIGHWDNPSLEVLHHLKAFFHKPTALVFHSNCFSLEKTYREDTISLLKDLDVIGFRNNASQKDFENKYFVPKNTFIAYSGVSEVFLKAGEHFQKHFSDSMNQLIYVGLLINRKYPLNILTASTNVYKDDFHLTYVGDGAEKATILSEYAANGKIGKIDFTGRIPRDKIISHLKESDIFVMISKAEVFGLVYLEAMALGVIPIGSRNEGIDGIVIDGYNGFLCEAGNTSELENILLKIRSMPKEELNVISENAKATAFNFSDKKVAEKYLSSLI